MTTNKEHTSTDTTSYDTIAKYFSEEARSLIPDTVIERILEEEKRRFENAALLHILPSRIAGNNTQRHCKDLLRKEQPLPFLYSALCFLSEVSIWMLLFGIFMGIGTSFTGSGFFTSFTFLYELILFSGVMICITAFRRHLNTILAIPFSSAHPSAKEISQRKSLLNKRRMFSIIITLLLMIIATGLVFFFELHDKYRINAATCFFIYVGCMILLGIHNVIYNSHWISFISIGFLLLTRQPDEAIEKATKQYLDLSYTQILSLSHKTLEDTTHNPGLLDKLKASVHSRMITGRIYYLLAAVILGIFDILCFIQLYKTGAPELIAFFIVTLLIVLILTTACLSANHILKRTK